MKEVFPEKNSKVFHILEEKLRSYQIKNPIEYQNLSVYEVISVFYNRIDIHCDNNNKISFWYSDSDVCICFHLNTSSKEFTYQINYPKNTNFADFTFPYSNKEIPSYLIELVESIFDLKYHKHSNGQSYFRLSIMQ